MRLPPLPLFEVLQNFIPCGCREARRFDTTHIQNQSQAFGALADNNVALLMLLASTPLAHSANG